ncbi:hypothetical protein TSEDIMI_70039 [Tenacibaculum sediminilitoris]|uniref:hypothetical protein n=1 Tax=Tenacibaculum sediminilitoris TaxID=1820334 RepID=UPI0038965ADD
MPYKSNISHKDFVKKLEGYQNEYKSLVNNDFHIINNNDLERTDSNEEPKRSFYDILFEPKYDSILDFFKENGNKKKS